MKHKLKNLITMPINKSTYRSLLFFIILALAFCFFQLLETIGGYGVLPTILFTIGFLLLCAVLACIVALLQNLLSRLRWRFLWITVFFLLINIISLSFAPYIWVICISGFIFSKLLFLVAGKTHTQSPLFKNIISYLFLVISGVFFIGMLIYSFYPGPNLNQLNQAKLSLNYYTAPDTTLTNPSNHGTFTFKNYYYAGNQKNCPYPNKEVILSKNVDCSGLLKGWNTLRTNGLSLKPESLPLNAKVWVPDGKGQYPLVLIAHGNHDLSKRSDYGYDYLSELLASQGYIVLSIDENFLNLSVLYDMFFLSRLQDENAARAYILLEHLDLMYDWSQDNTSVFYQKIDFDNIALIGHSRGGEAVALASMFSNMNYFPSNGSIQMDYPFSIKTVIAIAPVHRQFNPADMEITLEDINYLVLHGAQDMDVTYFAGADAYHKVNIDNYGVKAKVHMQNANHGQFNSIWGRNDSMGLANFAFNRRLYMEMDEQQKATKVFISAFLNAVMKEKYEYLSLFDSFSGGEDWLPATTYTIDYSHYKHNFIASFDEDHYLETSLLSDVTFEAAGFKTWTEKPLPGVGMINSNRVLALELENSDDETIAADHPIFKINFKNEQLMVGSDNVLQFSMCTLKNSDEDISFDVRVTDINGDIQTLPIEVFGGVAKAVSAPIYKQPLSILMDSDEPVLQCNKIDFSWFDELSGNINSVEFIFNDYSGFEDNEIFFDDFQLR